MNRTSVTYYVSAAKGDDQNSGTARDVPFRTLNRINGIRLLPGDRVLLERGSVFHSQFLRIESSGTEGQMIEIGAYGEGELPCIDADGTGIWHQDYGDCSWIYRLMCTVGMYPQRCCFMMRHILR